MCMISNNPVPDDQGGLWVYSFCVHNQVIRGHRPYLTRGPFVCRTEAIATTPDERTDISMDSSFSSGRPFVMAKSYVYSFCMHNQSPISDEKDHLYAGPSRLACSTVGYRQYLTRGPTSPWTPRPRQGGPSGWPPCSAP
jgi:hypothetical protein